LNTFLDTTATLLCVGRPAGKKVYFLENTTFSNLFIFKVIIMENDLSTMATKDLRTMVFYKSAPVPITADNYDRTVLVVTLVGDTLASLYHSVHNVCTCMAQLVVSAQPAGGAGFETQCTYAALIVGQLLPWTA